MERVNEFDLSYRNGDSGVKYLFKGPSLDWGLLRFEPGQELRIRPGDAVRLEPGEVHNITNDTEEPFEAVFIKTPHDPTDKVEC